MQGLLATVRTSAFLPSRRQQAKMAHDAIRFPPLVRACCRFSRILCRGSIGLYEKQLSVARELGHRRDEADALVSLGHAHIQLDDSGRAVTFYERASEIYQDVGDRRGFGDAMSNLGYSYYRAGDFARSVECYDRCAQIAREMGNEFGEAVMLVNKGYMLDEIGKRAEAIEVNRVALQLSERLRAPEAKEIHSLLEESQEVERSRGKI